MQLFIVKVESLVITNEYVVVNWTLSSVHSARHMLGAFEVRSSLFNSVGVLLLNRGEINL